MTVNRKETSASWNNLVTSQPAAVSPNKKRGNVKFSDTGG
jgi:hypothetical protein